jgi:hypothetical protein
MCRNLNWAGVGGGLAGGVLVLVGFLLVDGRFLTSGQNHARFIGCSL